MLCTVNILNSNKLTNEVTSVCLQYQTINQFLMTSTNHSTAPNSDSHTLLIQEHFSWRSSQEAGHAVFVCHVSPHMAILGKGVDSFMKEVGGSVSTGLAIGKVNAPFGLRVTTVLCLKESRCSTQHRPFMQILQAESNVA
jgi:hypothetical protein